MKFTCSVKHVLFARIKRKMKLSAHCKEDCELLGVLLNLPSIGVRARFIHRHLRPALQSRLSEHLGRIVGQAPTHRLRDDTAGNRVRAILRPHRDLINRVVKKARSRKNKRPFDLKTQRGGALFSILLAGLIPLIGDLIIRSVSK